MKIKKTLIEQIVKEEVQKIQELKSLQEERKLIKKQLNELYEEEGGEEVIEEGVSEEQAIEIINSHPAKKRAYEKFVKENPEKAEKFVGFLMRRPRAKYISWDSKKNDFVESGILTPAQASAGKSKPTLE